MQLTPILRALSMKGSLKMFDFSIEQNIIVLISAFCIGFSKTTGMSLGTAIIPFFSTAFPAKVATGILCISFLLASIQSFKIHFNSIKLSHFKILLPWVLLGFVIGGFFLLVLEDNVLRICICLTILSMLLFNSGKMFYGRFFEKFADSKVFESMCGILIGITSMVANAASPVMVVYLLAKKESKISFIATQVGFFLLIDCIKVPFYISSGIITSSSFTINLIMLPLMIIGGTLGFIFIRWLPENKFKIIVTLTSVLSALKLGFSAL